MSLIIFSNARFDLLNADGKMWLSYSTDIICISQLLVGPWLMVSPIGWYVPVYLARTYIYHVFLTLRKSFQGKSSNVSILEFIIHVPNTTTQVVGTSRKGLSCEYSDWTWLGCLAKYEFTFPVMYRSSTSTTDCCSGLQSPLICYFHILSCLPAERRVKQERKGLTIPAPDNSH